jgi:uncharacterized protein YdaU (DUF1376 family)
VSNNFYLPLHPGDYLADTVHLSAAEHGAYLLLIMNYWQRAKPLPLDDRKLRSIARMSEDEWSASKDAVLEFFVERDGLLHSEWLDGLFAFAQREARKESRPPYISPKVRGEVQRAFGGKCVYCNTDEGAFDVDHVIPWSRGGHHGMSNFAWACAPCNRSKKDMTPEEWGGRKQ